VSRRSRIALFLAGLACAAAPAAAQDFQPPESRAAAGPSGVRIDLLGFSSRVGIDVSRGGALVLGSAVDIAELGSPQVRLRPSFEYSGAAGTTAIHVATEVIFRFQPDRAPAIPYLGLGLGYYAPSEGSERLWLNVVMGFELAFRPSFNWLMEYHALDRLGRHRFLVGLSTRGSGNY
jgi:hypothetical protein